MKSNQKKSKEKKRKRKNPATIRLIAAIYDAAAWIAIIL